MTPGTYLRKRREAAQLTIEDAAEMLASLPSAQGLTFSARCDLLKRALIRIEGNDEVLDPIHAKVVRSAFPFDLAVYFALEPGGCFSSLTPRVCKHCACSEFDPCVDGEHSCSWSENDPEVCTTCEFVIAALTPGFFAPAPAASRSMENAL